MESVFRWCEKSWFGLVTIDKFPSKYHMSVIGEVKNGEVGKNIGKILVV